jgi:Aspartyl/Asparaginyl beta-hydroxylase
MFLDVERLPIAAALQRSFDRIDSALDRVRPDEFVEWVQGDAYHGSWRLFGVHHRDPAWVMADLFNQNGGDPRMVDVVALLARVPGLISSTFMWLAPGSHILPHVDDPAVHSVRTILGLRTHPGARMRVGDEVRTIERGKVYAFDSSVLHETVNEGAVPRVVFGVEIAYAHAWEPLRRDAGGHQTSLSAIV